MSSWHRTHLCITFSHSSFSVCICREAAASTWILFLQRDTWVHASNSCVLPRHTLRELQKKNYNEDRGNTIESQMGEASECCVSQEYLHLVGESLLRFRVAHFIRMTHCWIFVALLWIYSNGYTRRVKQSCWGLSQDIFRCRHKLYVLHVLR